jgi:hypothetical protein
MKLNELNFYDSIIKRDFIINLDIHIFLCYLKLHEIK